MGELERRTSSRAQLDPKRTELYQDAPKSDISLPTDYQSGLCNLMDKEVSPPCERLCGNTRLTFSISKPLDDHGRSSRRCCTEAQTCQADLSRLPALPLCKFVPLNQLRRRGKGLGAAPSLASSNYRVLAGRAGKIELQHTASSSSSYSDGVLAFHQIPPRMAGSCSARRRRRFVVALSSCEVADPSQQDEKSTSICLQAIAQQAGTNQRSTVRSPSRWSQRSRKQLLRRLKRRLLTLVLPYLSASSSAI